VLLELEVGPVGHGGVCIARHEGRVVFVRHAIPGERVRALVTSDEHESYLRADAVEILTASADRVSPPCRFAGAGRCGGCDWQHVSIVAQRRLKADVVREQFRRLAGLDVQLRTVEALPGGALGWRRRIGYAVDRDGRVGLHRHRSAELEYVTECALGCPGVGDAEALRQSWRGVTGLELLAGDDGTVTTLTRRPGAGRQARGRRPPDRVQVVDGPPRVGHQVGERRFEVDAAGFWQVHPAAAEVFLGALLDGISPRPGERVLELYAGAGALTAGLAEAVGASGSALGVESSAAAVSDAEANLADLPWATVRRDRVDETTVATSGGADLVVLDPPRAGAGTAVMAAIAGLRPRAVGYVACDPATLARDVRSLLDAGWSLASLRAFDAFPMTHHVECVAVLTPAAGAEAAEERDAGVGTP
jgi:tRNA/tmRNA/rRNA uracil-C5-methylase (TrmA/RlmC/RlmD family)